MFDGYFFILSIVYTLHIYLSIHFLYKVLKPIDFILNLSCVGDILSYLEYSDYSAFYDYIYFCIAIVTRKCNKKTGMTSASNFKILF